MITVKTKNTIDIVINKRLLSSKEFKNNYSEYFEDYDKFLELWPNDRSYTATIKEKSNLGEDYLIFTGSDRESKSECKLIVDVPFFFCDYNLSLYDNANLRGLTINHNGKNYTDKRVIAVNETLRHRHRQIHTNSIKRRLLSKPSLVWSLVYGLLCTAKLEGNTPLSFKSFCEEYGYNEDSIKDKELWEKCLANTDIIRQHFTESHLETFPS